MVNLQHVRAVGDAQTVAKGYWQRGNAPHRTGGCLLNRRKAGKTGGDDLYLVPRAAQIGTEVVDKGRGAADPGTSEVGGDRDPHRPAAIGSGRGVRAAARSSSF